MSTTHPLPPAGYYPDPDVPMASRYWDGENWAMRVISTTHIETSVAATAHLTGISAPVLVPALLRRLHAEEASDFERHSVTEALNFQLLVLLSALSLLLGVLFVPLVPGAWVALGILWGVAVVALALTAAREANLGRWYCYPVSLRVLRGARSREEAAHAAPVK